MKNIKKILSQNPNFNLQKDNLARLSVQEKFNWGRFKKEKWLSQLQTYQRLYRIHPDEMVVEQLMDKGYHSAHQIAATSEQQFTQKINGSLGEDPKVSSSIWQKSRAITYKVNQMAMALRPMPGDTAVMEKSVAVSDATGGDTSNDFETDIPSYNELFGPQYYCQCDECKSIWGPPAYFTDLMTTIEEHISLTDSSNTAFQETPFIFIENDQLKDINEDVVSNAVISTDPVTIDGAQTDAYHFDGTSCFELDKANTVFLPDGFTFECMFNLHEIPDNFAALFDCRDYQGSDHGITIYVENTNSGNQLQIWLEGETNIRYTDHYITLDTWYAFRIMVYEGNIEFWLTPQDDSGSIYTEKYTSHPYAPSAIGRLRVGAGASSHEEANYHWNGYIKNPIFKLIGPPKLSLKARRPDLWTMELNCDNTNTEVPYLQVANEVMAIKLQQELGISTLDNLDTASVDELEQYIATNIYPFNLPINLPEAEISGYLDHFGFSQSQVLDYLQAEAADIARMVFGISTNQLAFLTGVDASTGAPTTVDNDYLSQVFGLYEDTEKGADTATTKEFITSTNNFLRKTGLTINDLSDLFYQNNPAPSISKNAGTITLSPTAAEAALFHQLFINRDESTNVFLNYLQATYDQNTVANSSVKIEALSDTASGDSPSNNTLARLQRFIRLAQKINWTFTDLDWALKALGSIYMDERAIINLAKLQTTMNQFSIPVDVATALFASIKTYGQGNGTISQTLFDRVFNQPNNFNGAEAPYQPEFVGNPFFTDDIITWDYTTNLNENSSESSKIGSSLLATLQITETDLAALIKYFKANDFALITEDGIALTVDNLSLLYRYTQLPKLLKISIPQFCALLPFLPTTTFDTIDNLTAVIQYIQTVEQSLLSIGQVLYLLDTDTALPKSIQVQLERQQQMMLNQLQKSAGTVLVTPKSFVSPYFTEKEAEDLFHNVLVADSYIDLQGVVLDQKPISNLTLTNTPTQRVKANIQNELTTFEAADDATQFVITTLLRYQAQQNQLVVNALASFYKVSVATIRVGMVLTKRQLVRDVLFNWTSTSDIEEFPSQNPEDGDYNPRYLLLPQDKDSDYQSTLNDYLTKLPRNLSWLKWNQLSPLEGLTIAKNPRPLGIATMGYQYQPTFSDLMAISQYKQQCTTFEISGLEYLSYLEQKTNVDAFIFTKGTDLFYQNNQQIATNNEVTIDTETIDGLSETVFTFDGSSAYFEINNTGEPIIPTAFSFSCSFQLNSTGADGYSTIFSSRKHASGKYNGIILRYDKSEGKIAVWTNNNDSTEYEHNTINHQINLNTWYDLTITINGTNCYYRLTDKSTKQLLKSGHITLTGNYNPAPIRKFRLGSDIEETNYNAGHYWDGKISNPLFSEYANNATVVKKRQALANIAQWDINQLNFLIDAFIKKGSKLDFNTIQGVQTLINGFNVSQTMGIDTSLVWHLRNISPLRISNTANENWTNYTDVATEFKNAFVLHYGESDYQAAIAPLQSQIEERTRDFLSQLLIWQLGETFPDIQTQDQLYEFLLLDVEMTSTVNISKLKLGLNSLQLYVQRCMMNLERDINCTIPKEWWTWMSEYRMWQANREVYLYPENYIDPTLRKLQSPLFKDLVKSVKQSNITKESVTDAYTTYLDNLKEIANLKIVDSIIYPMPPNAEEEDSVAHKLITLFGRTFANPTTYYYRTGLVPSGDNAPQISDDSIAWTPWTTININVPSDYVTPVFAFGKLFLFWVTQQKSSSTVDVTSYPFVTATINYAYQQVGADWSATQVLASDILICAMSTNSDPIQYYTTSQTVDDPADYYTLEKWQKVEARLIPSSGYTEENILITLGDKVVSTDFNIGDTKDQTSPEQITFYNRIETVNSNIAEVSLKYSTILPGYLLTAGLVVEEIETAFDITNTEAFGGNITSGSMRNQLEIVEQYDFNNELVTPAATSTSTSTIISTDFSNDYIYDFYRNVPADNWDVSEQSVTINNTPYKALFFNGQSNLKLPSSSQLILPGEFHFSCFFKLTQTGHQYQIFDTKDNLGNGIGVYVDGRTLKLRLYDKDYGGGSDKKGLYSSLDTNKWYEFALHVTADSHTATYWVKDEYGNMLTNGGFETYNFSDNSNKGYTPSTDALYIGRSKDSHDYFFKGYIVAPLFEKYESSTRVAYIGRTNDLYYNEEKFDKHYVFSQLKQINDEKVDAGWFEKDAYYEIYKPGVTILPAAFSFSCNFQVKDTGALRAIFSCRNIQTGISEGVSLFYNGAESGSNNNKLYIEVCNSQNTTQKYYIGDPINTDIWYSLFCYIDNEQIEYTLKEVSSTTESEVTTIDISDSPYVPSTLGRLRLGAGNSEHDTANEYWYGYIQDPIFNEGSDTEGTPVVLNLENIPTISTLNAVKNQRSWFTLQTNTESFLAVPLTEIPKIDTVLSAIYPADGFIEVGYSNALANTSDLPAYQYIRLSTNVIEILTKTTLEGGVSSLLVPSNQYLAELDFNQYIPNGVQPPSSIMNFSGTYGSYFWELFYHIPMFLARSLQLEQQFQTAQQWYDVIFDPMLTQNNLTTVNQTRAAAETNIYNYLPMREYLLFRPFQTPDIQSIYDVLENEPAQVQLYEYDPFDPNAIAALRPSAYAKATVMQYIGNMIAYGDYLFTEDSWESINSATMYYTTAQHLLGQSPKQIPEETAQPDKSYQDFIDNNGDNDLPPFLVDLELEVPSTPPSITGNTGIDNLIAQRKSVMSDYFCVPSNDQLDTYRQTVEDRLYKIRNGLNISGAVNDLPLFQPPIDPAAAVAAAASGGAGAVSSMAANTIVPYYRFSYLIGVAKNFTAQVISFGGQLLSALEKQDSEHLSLLRETQSNAIQLMTTQMKEDQINQLYTQQNNLQANLANAQFQQQTYQNYIDIGRNEGELNQLILTTESMVWSQMVSINSLVSSPLFLLPDIYGLADGGMDFGDSVDAISKSYGAMAELEGQLAGIAQLNGSFERMNDDWTLQLQLAENNITGINAQLQGIQYQIDSAVQDYNINQTQINQSNEVINFLQTKFTNEQLYQWMAGQVSTIYFQAYQVAYNLANMAQAAFQYELSSTQTFISNVGWNDLYKGLTAGEALSQGLQQLEQAYVQQNNRYLEIEKTVSLAQLNPQALVDLKSGGTCNFSLTEQLFDLDFPGHYQRKIASIAITIPAIVGPYQNVHATLTQTSNMLLAKADTEAVKYALGIAGSSMQDGMYLNSNSNQSIAVSTANNDSGMFQLNFNDSRYLFFEGTGAISDWQLEMPKASNQFNFDSISDVIINLKYNAYDGGEAFKNNLLTDTEIGPILSNYSGTKYLSMKQYFGTAWHQFLRTGSASIPITRNMFIPNLTSFQFTTNGSLTPVLNEVYDTTETVPIMNDGTLPTTTDSINLTGTVPTHFDKTSPFAIQPTLITIATDLDSLDASYLKNGKINPEVWNDVIIQIPYTGALDW